MKYLFIVQGEGRGYLTQALTLEEMLRRNGHEVVEYSLARVRRVLCRGSLTVIYKRR
jgi:UDP:flavonoid glycosyltransferase YjiC (YdhE family)